MITFVSTIQNSGDAQKSALYTWMLNSISVVLVGSTKFDFPGISYVSDVRTEACLGQGGDAPFIKDMILKSMPLISTPMVGLINSDILIQEDFSTIFSRIVAKHGENVFLTGSRYDVQCSIIVDSPEVLRKVQENKTSHQDQSGDIFITSKSNFERMANSMPDLIVGRMVWDNWIHMYFRSQNIPCFNITDVLPTYHIVHGYNHMPGGSIQNCLSVSHNINLFKNSNEYARFSGEYVRVLQLPTP